MKKSILKAVLVSAFALPVLTACELDQFPTNQIVNEESWQTFDDAESFNRGILVYLRSISRSGWTASDVQADYFQPGLGYGNRLGQVYRWQYNADEDDPVGTWNGAYEAIANCNNFLNNYTQIEVTSAQEAALQQFVAEAYFVRAFAYYQLAVRFCKDYNAATAETDLGLPLVTEVDINAKPARATMQETWDFIKADADKAAEQIVNTTVGGERIPKQAVNALRARIALQTDNYDEALSYAKDLIDDDNFALASTEEEFERLWTYDEGDEIIFEPMMNKDEGRTAWSYLSYNVTDAAYSPDWIPAQATIEMYEGADMRSTWFRNTDEDGNVMTVKENETSVTGTVKLFAKFPGNPSLLKSSETVLSVRANAPKVFRLAEMYLIAAEAAYQNGDQTTAKNYLNALQSARHATPTDGGNILSAIKQEWKKEFIGEGQRIICLKRWGDDLIRNAAMQDPSVIVQANQDLMIALTKPASDMRWVWEISNDDLKRNSNLVPNWQ